MARGWLRIYLGAAPGVGKTYAMLNEGWRRRQRGTDVVVGFLETRGRANTAAQLQDIEVVPRSQITYRGQVFEEMDVDAVLARKPEVALIDELAHTNVPGSRNEKRWQDIDELLDAGIDVISTLNIQHLTSLNDVVERITGIAQRETVPDAVVRDADQIELVDMHPEALRRRMAHGNIYPLQTVDAALANYFRAGNLGALRELALLWVTDKVDDELEAYRHRYGIQEPWETRERIVVALTGAPGGEHLLQRAARIAAHANGELLGVHVRPTDGYTHDPPRSLDAHRQLLEELGGRYAEVAGADVPAALVSFARAENATQLVLGATGQSRLSELLRGSIANQVIRDARPIDVHVIAPLEPQRSLPRSPRRHRPVPVSRHRRQVGWLLATIGIVGFAGLLSLFRDTLGLPETLLILLLAVWAVAVVGTAPAAITSAVVAAAMAAFFFAEPYHSLRITDGGDLAAVLTFLAVAGLLSLLIDRLARRSLQVSRARAEAEALARLAGRTIVSAAEEMPVLVAEMRRAFALDGVAILGPSEDNGWRTVAAAGDHPPTTPDHAPFSADLDAGTVLAVSGAAVSAEDAPLLGAFVAQLRQTQERMALERDAATGAELAEANALREGILAAVSHDLRTPLASIKAASTSLLDDEVDWDPSSVHGFVKTIDNQADRLDHLITNLLDMSRIQAGAVAPVIRPVRLEDVLYPAVESLGPSASVVTIDLDPDLPPVLADAGLLERAVANLVDNAVRFSPPATPVRLEAGETIRGIDIRVIDQGLGIPEDQRDRIFQPFQRLGDATGDSRDGVGLGLAVARGFTEALDGELTIEDTPGGGATFVLSLRIAER